MRLIAPGFLLVALITLLALILYMVLTLRVAMMRGRLHIATPGTAGPPEFERALRIHAEHAGAARPRSSLPYGCARSTCSRSSRPGRRVWLIGRIVYRVSVRADPAKRSLPFAITTLATIGLIIGALVGVVLAYLR